VTVTRERIRLFNDAIIRQARRHGMPVVDLYSQPVEPSLVSDVDGFHPSNGGHARIAQLFLDVILPAIGLSQARLDVSGR
jgi:lysophospholipase L1-like esterase